MVLGWTSFEAESRQRRWRHKTAVAEDGKTVLVEVDFPPATAVVEGRATVDGQAIAGGGATLVVATASGEETWHAEVEGGRFRIEGIPAGKASLEIWRSKASRHIRFEIAEGQTVRRDVEVSEGAMVAGTIAGLAEGEEIIEIVALRGDVEVSEAHPITEALEKDPLAIAGYAQIADRSSFTFRGLEDGRYTIVLMTTPKGAGGRSPAATRTRIAVKAATASAGAPARADLVLE